AGRDPDPRRHRGARGVAAADPSTGRAPPPGTGSARAPPAWSARRPRGAPGAGAPRPPDLLSVRGSRYPSCIDRTSLPGAVPGRVGEAGAHRIAAHLDIRASATFGFRLLLT